MYIQIATYDCGYHTGQYKFRIVYSYINYPYYLCVCEILVYLYICI